jgi:protocatechuate 3,4-dioxygenase beta subunit
MDDDCIVCTLGSHQPTMDGRRDPDMDNDDRQIGRILSSGEVLALLGAAGAALLAACAVGDSGTGSSTNTTTPAPAPASPQTAPIGAAPDHTNDAVPACVVSPELTEGPYFVDERLHRSDIRSDPVNNSVKAGVPLRLTLRVSQVYRGGCTALPGAMVDIWHCDALGVYSDVEDPGFNTKGQKFLRGYQVTDENGIVAFTTIYPGWYQGRTVHIHFKVRSGAGSGQHYEFTSQLFFDDALSDQVFAAKPYANKGRRTERNEDDLIFRESGGQLTLVVTSIDEGYTAKFDIGLQLA